MFFSSKFSASLELSCCVSFLLNSFDKAGLYHDVGGMCFKKVCFGLPFVAGSLLLLLGVLV